MRFMNKNEVRAHLAGNRNVAWFRCAQEGFHLDHFILVIKWHMRFWLIIYFFVCLLI
jgi:hypothetical protein